MAIYLRRDVNNVIEHSKGENLYISIYTNCLYSRVIIVDDGEGVFRTLLKYMEKNGWDKPDLEDALIELYKGKITSKAENHSGEGIFFSSKMMDTFMIWSDSTIYVNGNAKNPPTIQSYLLAHASRIEKIGTFVYMSLENESERKIEEVFDLYADIDEGFVKTRIPIKEACINGEPVARSQARRICNRLDTFKEVVLDFSDIEFMGQGFSDELFRVYALAHPQVLLRPVNMLPSVARMVRHVARGNMPANIIGMD